MKHLIRLLSIFFLASIFSCDNSLTFEEQLDIDKQLIADYVAANNLSGQSSSNGIFYGFTEQGDTTTYPTLASTVEVVYTGKLLDGTVFDSSEGFPVSFQLFQTIQGWQQGIPFFSEGTKGYLLIPSNLAYGIRGSGIIPPSAVLYFDVELLDVR